LQKYSMMLDPAAAMLASWPPFQQWAGADSDEIARQVTAEIRRELPAEDLAPSRMTTSAVIANAVSEAYGLTGPSVTLDAVCSSSLKALAVAQRDIAQGVTEMAIVGGAYTLTLDPLLQFGMSQAAAESRSCPFSDEASGAIISEAYVTILVKPLERALADGDNIDGVIRSIGVSADGRGKGTWAPRKEGQVLAIRRAYRDEAEMRRLVYLEAHATSTPVGDQTEMESLAEVFGGVLPAKRPMGSFKANLGHTLEAAGMVGLVKAMLVLKHGTVPRQIHCERLNRQIDWDALPFFVPREATPLPASPDGQPRLAGVNAFGIGGINAHAVIEEPPAVRRSSAAIPASAFAGEGCERAPRRRHFHCEPIAIVGRGAIFPGAHSVNAFNRLVQSEANAITPVPEDRWLAPHSQGLRALSGGFVQGFEYDWRRRRISPKQIEKADPILFMLLETVEEALRDAGYDRKNFDRQRTEVIVGANFETDFFPGLVLGGRLPHFLSRLRRVCRERGLREDEHFEALARGFVEHVWREIPSFFDELGSFTASGLASRIAKVFDLMGGAGAVDSGDTSAAAAIAQALASLRAGASDLVICAAGSRSVGLQLHAASHGADPTMDAAFPPGEGAATLLLKRLADAQRDGDPIRGVIHAAHGAFSSDPETAFSLAVRRAWEGIPVEGGPPLLSAAIAELSTAGKTAARAERAALTETCGALTGPARIAAPIHRQIGATMAASAMASLLKCGVELDHSAASKGDLTASPGNRTGIETASSLDYQGKPMLSHQAPPSARPVGVVSSYDPFGTAYHLIMQHGAPTGDEPMTDDRSFPLLSAFHAVDDAAAVAEVVLDPRRDLFLLGHQFRSRPILPGVFAAESMAEAAVRAASTPYVTSIGQIEFVEGLRFSQDEPQVAKVHVRQVGSRCDCRLTVDFRNRRGDLVKADRVYTTASVELAAHPPRLAIPFPAGRPTRGWYKLAYLDDVDSAMIFHGPGLRQVRRVAFGESASWGECQIGPAEELTGERAGSWHIFPATLDACLYVCVLDCWRRTEGVLSLPRSVAQLRFGRPPRAHESCVIHCGLKRLDERGGVYDFTLLGEDRAALAVGEGCFVQLVPTSKQMGAEYRRPRLAH